MKIRPNENFRPIGLGYFPPTLDKNRVYDARPATNQPDWEKKGKVFVSFNDDGEEPSIMLDHFDYEIVES